MCYSQTGRKDELGEYTCMLSGSPGTLVINSIPSI